MIVYEQRCRVLLNAFPREYRAARGDEIVGVLLDTGAPDQRWPSLRTAGDLLSAGLRVRSKLTSQGRASVAVIEGMRVAALVGLLVQAAFSVAMIVHRAHDGVLFYATSNAWSTSALDLVAASWVIAFVLVVAGRSRLAVVPAVFGATAGVIIFAANFAGNFGIATEQPLQLLTALQMTLLGVVPTLALIVAAFRRPRTSGHRSLWWLAAFAGLTGALARLDSGIRITAYGRSMRYPLSGSLVLFLFWICVAGLVVMLLASMFDPRLGVAVIVVSLPIVVYQVGLLVAGERRPGWSVVLALGAFATTAVVAVTSAVSLRRLRPS
jgi:hypothetical protein